MAKTNDFEEAIAKLTQSIEIGLNTPDWHLKDRDNWALARTYYHRGVLKNKIGDAQGAFSDLTEALRLHNSCDPSAFFELAIAQEQLQDNEGALTNFYLYFDRLRYVCDATKDNAIEAHCRCAGLKFKAGDMKGALKDLRRAQSLVHQQAGFDGRTFADTRSNKSFDFKPLLKYYESALANDPPDIFAVFFCHIVHKIYGSFAYHSKPGCDLYEFAPSFIKQLEEDDYEEI